jgi:uncharacterized protein (TIGR02611 family)
MFDVIFAPQVETPGRSPSAAKPPLPTGNGFDRMTRSIENGVREVARSRPVKYIKRAVVLVIGGTVVLIGIALLVLPGPAIVVIPMGLGILALEFAWARRWLRRARELMGEAAEKTGFATNPKGRRKEEQPNPEPEGKTG